MMPRSGIRTGTSLAENRAEQGEGGVGVELGPGVGVRVELLCAVGVRVAVEPGIPVAVGTCGIGVRVGLGGVL
jgi:hypothetical protein